MEKYTELEEMKAQLALLNKKLEKETIVNERLIRRAMKNKAWGIRRKIIAEIILCFLMIPFFIWLMPAVVGLSMGFCYYGAFLCSWHWFSTDISIRISVRKISFWAICWKPVRIR